jgi:hypothetical protein
MEQVEIEGLRQEYAELRNDLRNHSNLRFTIFAVYLAAIGGLGSIAFGLVSPNNGNPQHIKLLGRIAGLVVTLMFFIYELRIQSLIKHCLERGEQIEKLLFYEHIRKRRDWKKWGSSNWAIGFFVIMLVFWFVTCYWMHGALWDFIKQKL